MSRVSSTYPSVASHVHGVPLYERVQAGLDSTPTAGDGAVVRSEQPWCGRAVAWFIEAGCSIRDEFGALLASPAPTGREANIFLRELRWWGSDWWRTSGRLISDLWNPPGVLTRMGRCIADWFRNFCRDLQRAAD